MTDAVKHVSPADVDERLAAVVGNASAIQAIASAVEGTLGPKGLNCMLVDRYGDVTVTNDGSTILAKVDVSHPAARMLIHTARAQDAQVGDGTTTATILAAALIAEGVKNVSRGVPVTKVIEGIRAGVECAVRTYQEMSVPVRSLKDPNLFHAAHIAGRERPQVAELIVRAARLVGRQKLLDPGYKLRDAVVAKEGAQNQVVRGVIVDKERLNKQMPRERLDCKVLVVDDALEPEQVDEEALATEAGFRRSQELREEFLCGLGRLVELGVGLVVVDRGVHDLAEEVLTDAQVMVVRRVTRKDITRVLEHTGAKAAKRSSLYKSKEELIPSLGHAQRVYEDEHLQHVRIEGGGGKPVASILIGAATREVRDEQQRIAEDAAAALQACVQAGYVPGGGAAEIAALRRVQQVRERTQGMASYGVDCVIEALKRPLAQMVANAGYNPLEKVETVIAAQAAQNSDRLAVEFGAGEVTDMVAVGVIDPTLVKVYALQAAGEIAEAILRINTVIRKRDEKSTNASSQAGGT